MGDHVTILDGDMLGEDGIVRRADRHKPAASPRRETRHLALATRRCSASVVSASRAAPRMQHSMADEHQLACEIIYINWILVESSKHMQNIYSPG